MFNITDDQPLLPCNPLDQDLVALDELHHPAKSLYQFPKCWSCPCHIYPSEESYFLVFLIWVQSLHCTNYQRDPKVSSSYLLKLGHMNLFQIFNYHSYWYTQHGINIPSGKGSFEGGSPWKAYHCIFPWPTSEATKYWFMPKNTRYLQVITKSETLSSRIAY